MKEVIDMILFTILLLTLAVLIIFTVAVVSVGGAAFIVIFSDVIVCIALLVWIIKIIAKKRGR